MRPRGDRRLDQGRVRELERPARVDDDVDAARAQPRRVDPGSVPGARLDAVELRGQRLELPLERVATLMNAGDRIAGAVSPARRRARAAKKT